jgi:short-subunit dehydrogenase
MNETNNQDNFVNPKTNDKIVVIIGASTKLGSTIAINMKQSGYNVIIGGKETSSLVKLQQMGIVTFSLDIKDKVSVERFIIQISKFVQKIDVLINTVDEATFYPFEMSTINSARNMFEENVFAPADLIVKMIPMLERTGQINSDINPSKIIHITSIASRMAMPLSSWYSSTNHAIDGLMDGIRPEFRKMKIQVVTIQTGLLRQEDSATQQDFMEINNEKYTNLMNKVSLKTKDIRSGGVSADSIARLTEKVVKTKAPRTKYIIGREAKFISLIQRIFGQKIAEAIIRKTFHNFGN